MAKKSELTVQETQLSPEFFDLIYVWDPDAANDDYYVTSSEFVDLHAQIKKDIIRSILLWVTSICVAMLGLILFFG